VADERVAVVTGGNRGLGLAICRGLAGKGVRVILAARDARKGEDAAAALRKEGLPVRFHPLDVTDAKSIEALASFVAKEYGKLDILVNNAAIRNDRDYDAGNVPVGIMREAMEANALGPLLLAQRLAPLLRKSGAGRIVNVSSGMGSLAGMGAGSPAYRTSKVALNAVTRLLADELGLAPRRAPRRAPTPPSGSPSCRRGARRAATSATGSPCPGEGIDLCGPAARRRDEKGCHVQDLPRGLADRAQALRLIGRLP
jgi:NAD(P)-dependent dehydrogenase (short-subunit alcohol dehydrogenase family)